MCGFVPRTLILLLCSLCLPALSQEGTAVRVGVALMGGDSNQISAAKGRDRLVKALNHHKNLTEAENLH